MAAATCANSQVWLTYVLNDLDVPKALTLYFSMKRVFTSRKLAVFVSHNVSVSKREVLHQVFDFFFYLEKERNTAGLKDEEFVKLSTFSLKCFEKVVKSTVLLQRVGENLSGLFKGTKSAISILFPEGTKDYPSMADFYDDQENGD
ncbi:unnamed protein product [Orchesella dallaii]|uniref:Uncharacterized protein n=1 Tax=Orchesella dallaii TaxID=48710 RepID=A0ABP1Q2G1_9HEXA